MTETPIPEPVKRPTCGPGSTFKGKAGRSGPAKGNRNSMRHGLRGGKLPEGAQYIENQVNAVRRQVEDAVIAAKGSVSLVDAALVQTIARWERHAALATRWLRVKGKELTPTETLQFSREIARASSERDRALQALGLDAAEKAKAVPWLALAAPTGPAVGGNGDGEAPAPSPNGHADGSGGTEDK